MKFARLPAALTALLALSLAVPSAPLAHAQVRLPALGEQVSEDFGVGPERRLGDQIMREVRRDPAYLDDPQLLDYLDSLWQPLLKAARDRGEITAETDTQFAWETFLVRDRSVNAFALPGGYVGMHLGLISMTTSSDELAAVLAHELSHVTQRHIARGMVNSQRQSLIGLAALILGTLAASRASSTDAMQAVVAGSQAAVIQGQLNFSRDMEREADRIGHGVLTDAGFSPAGVAAMFEKLEQANRINDSGAYPYLRTHPLTTERIGEARSRSAFANAQRPPLALEHAVMQARARALMDTSAQALRRLQGSDSVSASASLGERITALYSSALASTQLRDWSRADKAIDQAMAALQGSPDDKAMRALQWLRVQSLVARGDAGPALALIDSLGNSRSRSALLLRAQAASAAAEARLPNHAAAVRQSMEALQTWVSLHPNDAGAWTLLAQNAHHLGLKLRALRSEAESRASVGDLGGAIDRLRAGQRIARSSTAEDFVDASIVEARLRDLEQQRRQQMIDLRAERRLPRGEDDEGR